MKVPDRQKREEADWGTLKKRDKGGKTSPLEAKEDNRRATRQAPPRPFAMSNTSIRIFISMKYERYKKNCSFPYYMSELGQNNFFKIILVENSICNLYSVSKIFFFMECVDLPIDQQAQPLQNVFSSGCPPTTATGEKWWKTQHSNRFLCIFCMINHHHPLHPSQLAQDLPVKKTKLKMYVMEKVLCISVIWLPLHCNTHLFQEKNCKNCLTSPITR